MKNVIIIHSYNGDTEKSFAPSIKEVCRENDIDYYFPNFPIRSEATYESWEEVLDEYRDKGILNSDSIVISHSLGTQFIIKYLAKHNINIDNHHGATNRRKAKWQNIIYKYIRHTFIIYYLIDY